MKVDRTLASMCLLVVFAGCGSEVSDGSSSGGGGGASTSSSTVSPTSSTAVASTSNGTGGADTTTGIGGSAGTGGAGGSGTGGGGGEDTDDPVSCAEAAARPSHLGCEFWPTVTANLVWSIFDFAAVVTNGGDAPAEVVVDRDGEEVASVTVAAGEAETIYLPWIEDLKGPDADCNGGAVGAPSTARVPGGAYRVLSSVPVAVYQFSALEYAPQGGPPGKDWSACPGNQCATPCFSYSNDASLLFPTSSLGTDYRIAGFPSWVEASIPAFLTITGVEDGTSVTVTLGTLGGSTAGSGILAAGPGGSFVLPLARGEVVQIMATVPGDLSGSLVQANQPIQVLHGLPCARVPDGTQACDHLEEAMLPAVTLGDHYLVATPTSPLGFPVGHVVRFVGNVDGTSITYPGARPPGAPTTLDAGEVVDLGVVSVDFEVQATDALTIATFQQGGSVVDPANGTGDPAQSIATPVAQFRRRQVFVAPVDYDTSFVDVIMPADAAVTLDGAPLSASTSPISSGFVVARARLGAGNGGAHVLESDLPVGIQVLGYGLYTSYQYPGGLSLDPIAPPPR